MSNLRRVSYDPASAKFALTPIGLTKPPAFFAAAQWRPAGRAP
jgi:hypothetical protein